MRHGLASVVLSAVAAPAAVAAAGGPITQLGQFPTGFNGSGVPLVIPAIDPSGLEYHAPSGHLFIVDAEIEEVPEAFAIVGANVFEVSTSGTTLYGSWDLTELGDDEPTGIAYNPLDGFFYVSNDDTRRVTRYSFSPGSGFDTDDFVNTLNSAGMDDPEGIACDPASGLLYVLDGHGAFVAVYSHDGSAFTLEDILDIPAINDPANVPLDPEGIAYDACSGHLLLVTSLEERIYEFTGNGFFLARYDISGFSPAPIAPQGLTIGPTSATGDDPDLLAIYIADGGVDNNDDPDERDGEVFEAALGCTPGEVNLPPLLDPIPDLSVEEGEELSLVAEAFDPDAGDVLVFSLAGNPPAGASIGASSGVFTWTPTEEQGPADHDITVRVTDNGIPPLSDETTFTVTVLEANTAPVIDAIPDQVVQEETLLALVATASDSDPGTTLTFSLTGNVPAGAEIDPSTGFFSWTPSEAQGPGSYTLTVRVTDDGAGPLSDQTSFDVNVTEVNAPPVLDPIGDKTVAAAGLLAFTATATDPDGGPGSSADLLAHWPFDSGFESTTGAHGGTPQGGAALTTLPGDSVLGGGALALDGVDDYVVFGDIPLAGDLTVAAWVRPLNVGPSSTSQAVVLGDGDNDDWLRIDSTNVRIRFDGDSNAMSTDPDFVNGEWQHLALVRSGVDVIVYRNGAPAAEDVQDTIFTPEFLGHKTPTPNFYAGLIDDAAIWDGALSAGDVAELHNGGAGLPANQLNTSGLAFSLLGDVPPGAAIDPETGAFTWTAPPEPVSHVFTVRVTDGGVPPLFDEETITVTVTAACPADLDGSGTVAVPDLLLLLAAWGTSGPGDLDGDGTVGITDLLALLEAWGPC